MPLEVRDFADRRLTLEALRDGRLFGDGFSGDLGDYVLVLAVDVALEVVDCGLNSAVWAPDRGVGSLRHEFGK